MKRIMKITSPVREVKNNFTLTKDRTDSVLYMGKVFAVLCPKRSIASKYRGYDLLSEPIRQVFKVTRVKDPLLALIKSETM